VRSGRDADYSPHLVPRSKMSRSYILPLPLDACIAVAVQLYFFTFKEDYTPFTSVISTCS
jgi:hypothetical protein